VRWLDFAFLKHATPNTQQLNSGATANRLELPTIQALIVNCKRPFQAMVGHF